MIPTIRSALRRWRHTLRRWALDPRVHLGGRIAACLLGGFALSAASLLQHPLPVAMGLVAAAGGWSALLTALGASAGYLLLWGRAGWQGPVWMAGALVLALLRRRTAARAIPLLLPALAAAVTAGIGLAFQLRLGDDNGVGIYLLRLALAGGSTWVLCQAEEGQSPSAQWLRWGIWVLALAQLAPVRWLCLGVVLAGALAGAGAFPAVAAAGLALDLAQIGAVPMTAVLCVTYFLRQLPGLRRWMTALLPGAVYLLVMSLCGLLQPQHLPALLLGGLLGLALPGQRQPVHRRGETGAAQVRLELAAGVFAQLQQLLLETPVAPVDEEALVRRAAERTCGGCPCRKGCRERETAAKLPPQLLHRPLLDRQDLPVSCRKADRLLQELHRTQEQLRAIRADRERQREYREAVQQQYRFLGEYLQALSDQLGKRMRFARARYKPQVTVRANRDRLDNGDRCLCFAGVGCSYYVVLCDGMGTGLGAVDEGRSAARMLQGLLCAGYPAEHALRSFNSLLALRGRAGAATADLLQLHLDTGSAELYKWGAAPSYLLRRGTAEKIGTAGPPPGLSVGEGRETVERLSLRRGEALVLCSDGVGPDAGLCCADALPEEPPEELAARILGSGTGEDGDDATVAVVRLVWDPSCA